MSREIKFRAWDKKQKRWTNYSITDDLLRFYDKHLGCWKTDKENNRFILVQYTGIKDKNNKDIYEGDIVKTCYGTCKVEYKLDSYHIVSLNDNFSNLLGWQETEIIGNIYENEELLKDE